MRKDRIPIIVMTKDEQQELLETAIRKALHDYQTLPPLDQISKRMLSAKETQAMIGCSATTLWRLGKLSDGGLYPVHLASHKIAYKLSDIEKYLEIKASFINEKI